MAPATSVVVEHHQNLQLVALRPCTKPYKSLQYLNSSLRREWNRIPLEELQQVVENFKTRPSLCIHAKGDDFENASTC